MVTRLRNLALIVSQAQSNQFHWTIREASLESTDYAIEVLVAKEPSATYRDAMRSGYDALDTMAQIDPTCGPQTVEGPDVADVLLHQVEYNGRLIEVFIKHSVARAFFPYLRVHAKVNSADGWECPQVPVPRGGFLELPDAIETALTVGESLVDGHDYEGPFDLVEGGSR